MIKSPLLQLSLLLISILLIGCSSHYPLGMNEEQWNTLSLNERKELLLKQQASNEKLKLARIKSEELQLQKDLEKEKRITYAYKHPNNGNVIMVNILAGRLIQNTRHQRLIEESYTISRGESKKINLIFEDSKTNYTSNKTAYLKYAMQGNAVYLSFNPLRNNNGKRIALLRDGKWNCGSQYKKRLNDSRYTLMDVRFFVKELGSNCPMKARRLRNF